MSEFSTLTSSTGFEWIDVVDPSAEDILALAEKYGLHSTSVQDCLDPEHLPKYEVFEHVKFIIMRAYDEKSSDTCDTVEELTRKVAMFYSDKFLITVHRVPMPFSKQATSQWEYLNKKSKGLIGAHIFSNIMKEILNTYEKPIDSGLTKLEKFEMGIFNASGAAPFQFQDGYYLKRQAFVYKRILRYSHDVLLKLSSLYDTKSAPYFQDLREHVDNLYFYAEELQESINGLLNLHISMSSQKTNEASQRTNDIMRVLTIVSVIFMPLSFLAGVYGMNFKFMPELELEFGYPVILSVMATIALSLLFLVRKKGWMD
jgi:magnesium transporter